MFYSSKNKNSKQEENIDDSKALENEIIIVPYNDLKNDNLLGKNIDLSKKEVRILLVKLLIFYRCIYQTKNFSKFSR